MELRITASKITISNAKTGTRNQSQKKTILKYFLKIILK